MQGFSHGHTEFSKKHNTLPIFSLVFGEHLLLWVNNVCVEEDPLNAIGNLDCRLSAY